MDILFISKYFVVIASMIMMLAALRASAYKSTTMGLLSSSVVVVAFALFTAGALVVVGLFAAIFIDNIVKKIIGISFIEEGANLFIIAIGYKPGGVVPILMPGMSPSWFAVNSAYPLPFGFGLKNIP
jgi:multisubunit Na+/H+ antiporter MnhC subunit